MFFKKRAQRDDDRIWMTTDLKWNGIVNEILKELTENVFILVVAHFKKTAAELKKQFQSRGLGRNVPQQVPPYGRGEGAQYEMKLPFREAPCPVGGELRFNDYEWHSHFGQWETEIKNQPVLIMAENISELGDPIRQFGESKRVLVLVAEHYPLPEGDEALFPFLSNLPSQPTIRFHSALDEPLFKIFGGDRISNVMKMLETLGQGEKEYISHPLVTSAIQRAQKDIRKKATGNNRVDSMEEWFQYNLNIG